VQLYYAIQGIFIKKICNSKPQIS